MRRPGIRLLDRTCHVVLGVLAMAALAMYAAPSLAEEVEQIPLWEDGAPGEPPTKPEDQPVLFVYRPAATEHGNAAVVICPGGGYNHLAIDHEGHQIGQWFRSLGVAAFVLKYRHRGTGHRFKVPMMDGKRAIRLVRAHADQWNLDPAKIGILGFSAGGHLASTVGTQFDAGQLDASDPIERVSSRPDFMILCYPVITMSDKFLHSGSRDNLITPSPERSLARGFSSELRVSAETPPTFLFQTDADPVVPAENSVAFYLALRKAGVPAEMHIFQQGGHGLGLAPNDPAAFRWPELCRKWMEVRGLLPREDDRDGQ